jgi:phosphate transport system substrate-binding protein
VTKKTFVAAAAALMVACGGDRGPGDGGTAGSRAPTPTPANASGSVDLTGAGATFPYPIYNKWFSDYAAKTGVRINYQSIGSGGGIRQLSEGTVDFGASDSPMRDDELAKAKGGEVLHFPSVAGAVVVTYNVQELGSTPLRLTGPLIADIFLGKITKWNDPRIGAVNPGARLPAADLLVVHRSDGSGTTYAFSDYLATVSPEWARSPGRGKELKWPTGLGAKGNEGVAGQVKQLAGTVGYVELAYAKQNGLAYADVQNPAGEFVRASIESINAATNAAMSKLPPNTDYRVSIVNSAARGSYPIASYTWLLVYRNQPDSTKGKKLADFLRWALTEGEQTAAALDFAPLPQQMAARLVQRIDSLRIGAGAR